MLNKTISFLFGVLLQLMRNCSQSMTASPIFILEFGAWPLKLSLMSFSVVLFELVLNQTGFLDSQLLCC